MFNATLMALELAQSCPGGGCAGPGSGSGFWPGMGYGGGYGWGIFGMVFMFLFWALIITAVVYLIKHVSGDKRIMEDDNSLKILNERYARGEITKEEFEKMKTDLKKM